MELLNFMELKIQTLSESPPMLFILKTLNRVVQQDGPWVLTLAIPIGEYNRDMVITATMIWQYMMLNGQ